MVQLIAEGSQKLASVPSGGGGGGAAAAGGAAAGGAAAEAPEEEKVEGTHLCPIPARSLNRTNTHAEKEESDEDMGFGLFD